jgi:hypothetical protein
MLFYGVNLILQLNYGTSIFVVLVILNGAKILLSHYQLFFVCVNEILNTSMRKFHMTSVCKGTWLFH